MLSPDLPSRAPERVAPADLQLPASYSLSFDGFGPEAFAILDRLREEPHIEQYREEKPGIAAHLKAPFKQFRDDLALNFILPNRLDLETERNVFSRLLKNDFGAGGCHHHLWMAFYRPERKRLTDVQLSHSISPDDFITGLYVGDYATDLLKEAKQRITAQPKRFLDIINPLLEHPAWQFSFYAGTGKQKTRARFDEPLSEIPDDLMTARGIWIRRSTPRDEVIEVGSGLVAISAEALLALWPVYRFWLTGAA